MTKETFIKINKPSKDEQKLAIESYDALTSVIDQLHSKNPEIEIQETQERIKIPLSALKFLNEILKAMSQGKPFSLVPVATEVTTQKAAEIIGCSRPHIVRLLEDGQIEYTKVGKHRRIKFEDVMRYKKNMKKIQKQNIIDIMKSDEELGLYNS
ncbi:helix-turn-helix domain-containing protein [Aequorivita flava]|uniref:Helix-turn-helix domain-containing protein n=1 Tax=Aequorivita flava TaxID=3114371 RepID=A0AB35YW54_9FLAO